MKDTSLQVVLKRCIGYDQASIANHVDAALAGLGMHSGLHGKIILLKPNLISSGGPGLACTHPQFIAGVAACMHAHGAKVLLGDSPAFGSAIRVCEKHGIISALKALDVRIVEFSTAMPMRLAGGVVLTIAREALECDILVGLPKIKAHNQLYVTMAVKNLFGIVKGVNKAMLHMIHGSHHDGFAEILLDLVDLLPSQIHLADGIMAMHISGPLDGEPLPLYCMAAANSAVAMDTALLAALELDPRLSPLWRVAMSRRLAGSHLEHIDFPELSPQDFWGSGFQPPSVLNPIRFNPARFIRGLLQRMRLKICS